MVELSPEPVGSIWEWQHNGDTRSTEITTWSGSFQIPPSMSPGRQNIPIHLEDQEGGSTTTTLIGGILSSEIGRQAEKVLIGNQPPSITNLTILRDGNPVDQVTSLNSGGELNYTLEATIQDFDGVSSVQAKIGRLAPIGQSEVWQLMSDNGIGPDRVANDGVFSLEFSARSSLSEGEMTLLIRATDIFLSTTADQDQQHNVSITKSDSVKSGSSWISSNSTTIILISLVTLLAVGVGAFINIVRNSELD